MRREISRLAGVLALVCAGFFARTAQCAIAVDSTSSVDRTFASSATWSHTVGSGANRILVVGISLEDAADSVSGITYGGVALTRIGTTSDQRKAEIWRLVAPASGTANIVASFSGSVKMVGGAVSFTGVHQTTPTGTFVGDSGTGSSASVIVSSASGELVIDTLSIHGGTTASDGGGQTERWNRETGPDTTDVIGAGSTEAGASSVTMSWSWSGNYYWSLGAVPLKPASSTGADVVIAKSGSTSVSAGESIIYTISVTNVGPWTATNVVVSDTIPSQSTFVSASSGGTHSAGVVTWPTMNLASNAYTNFTVTATAPSSGSITNVASSDADTPDGNSSNNDGTAAASRVITSITPQGVSLDDTSSDTTSGTSSFSWSHTVSSGANRLLIVGISIESSSDSVTSITYGGVALTKIGRTSSSRAVEIWRLVAPAVGTATIAVNFSSSATAVGGAVSFFGINQTTPNGTYAGASGTADNSGSVSVSSAVGELVIDTISLHDPGSISAGGGQTERWETSTGGFNDTRGGGSTEAGASSVTMSWSWNAGQNGEDWSLGAVSLKPYYGPDVSTTKTGATNAYGGSNLTYTITVTNAATGSTATNVVVTDALPAGTAFVSASSGGTSNNDAVTWPTISTMAAGASTNFTLTITAPMTGAFTNVVSSTSTSTDPEPANNNGTASGAKVVTTIVPHADVVVAKTGVANVWGGSNVTYTINVTNRGPVTSTNVIVKDALPAGAAFISASSGGTSNSGVVTWPTISAMAVNATTNYTLTIRAPTNSIVSLTNQAYSTSSTADGNTNNNNTTSSDGRVVTTVYWPSLSGNVFEDVNYGGGAGRTKAASSGTGLASARVELFNSAGNYLRFTNTDSSGNFTFLVPYNSTNTVRVVNSSVVSSRPGGVGGLLSVQTYRTDGSSGAAVDVTDRVGGETPYKADAGNGSTTLAALATSTTAAQSVSTNVVTTNSISTIHFGFNFDTIVNTNNTGQGSLRQFLVNANTLGNSGLAQSGQTSGKETSVFMISDGAAHSGLRAGIANQLSSGVALIVPSTALPAITDTDTTIDGGTQTSNVGDNNAGQLGVGGTVGVDALTLNQVNRPEVQIQNLRSSGVLGMGLSVQANNTTIRKVAIYGFGSLANANTNANIHISSGITGTLIEQNVIGASATSFTDPGSSARSGGDNIRSAGGDSGTIQNNLIGFSAGKGCTLTSSSDGWLIVNNEVRGNGIGNATVDGVDIESSATTTVRGNLFVANYGCGIDSYSSSGGNTFLNNTVAGNGITSGASPETAGIRVYGAGNTIDRNIVTTNFGAGIMLAYTASTSKITKNSVYLNGTILNLASAGPSGQIGIDLLKSTDDSGDGTSPFYTINDSGDSDTGANGLLNFPVITSALVSNATLFLAGYARSGSAIEFFIANADSSGFGEGQTYLTTLTEGSGSDSDSGTGTYSNPVNGLNQGTDNTSKFRFVIANPAGVTNGAKLTATATDAANNSSEFGGIVSVISIDADVAVTKTGATNVVAGSNLTYTITVTNLGPVSATNLIVRDTLPTNAVFVSATSGGTNSNGTVIWPTMATFAYARTTNFTVTITAPTSAKMTNYAWSTATNPDPTASNNNGSSSAAIVITTITPSANLATTKTGTTNVTAGSNITYTITMTNLGPSTASNIFVRDNLPSGVTFVSATGGGTYATGVVTWASVTNFPVNSTTNFTVIVTAPGSGPLTNTIWSTSTTGDPVASNNDGTAAAAKVVTTVVPSANVKTTKSGPTTVEGSSNVTYVVTVTNLGPSTASNIIVRDFLPSTVVFVSATGGGTYATGVVTWASLTNFASGATTNFTVQATAPANGTFTNTVLSVATTGDPDASNNNGTAAAAKVVTLVSINADVIVTKSGPTIAPGNSNITYSIVVTNLGPSTASNLVVIDTLPAGSTFISATSGGIHSGGMVTWPTMTNFAKNRGTNFTVTVRTPLEGLITNIASSTSTTLDPYPENNDGSDAASRVITQLPVGNVSGYVYLDANHNLQKDSNEAGTGLSLYAKIFDSSTPSGPALQVAAVNGTTGAYTLTNIVRGTYIIIINDNNTVEDVGPAIPDGWTGTEMPTQTRVNVAVTRNDVPNQNFGVIASVTLIGKVFKDNGAGAGTANDGEMNGTEAGLAGVVVKLTDSTGATVHDTTTTDGSGNYRLHVPSALANGTELKVVEVNPPTHLSTGVELGNTGGAYDRAADTVTFTLAVGTAYTGINFGDVPENSFVNESHQAALPGSFAIHAHSFTAGSGGSLAFSVASLPNPTLDGWSQVIYRDLNCNGALDPGEIIVSDPLTVAAGDKICILVKDFVPVTATFNSQDQLTVTAAFTWTGASPALSTNTTRIDLTTAGSPTTAGLTLLKSVDKETALPGEVLVYTVTYANKSSAALTNIVIFDQTPAFTTFATAGYGALPNNITAIAVSAPAVAATGPMRWTFTGSLAPSSSGTVTFSVTISH